MNKNLQNIDKLFIQFLENYKEEPPENAWNAIENELNRRDAIIYKSKYTLLRRIFPLLPFTNDSNQRLSATSVLTRINPVLMDSFMNAPLKDLKQSILLENQTASNIKKEQTKPTHPFYISPYFSFDHITGRVRKVYKYDDLQPAAKRESLDISYTAGIHFEYGLSGKASLQSGLLFSSSFTSISPAIVKALQDNWGSYKFRLATNYGFAEIKQSGFTTPQSGDSIVVSDGFLNIQSVSIPMLLKVNVKAGRLNINGMGGGAINRITRDMAEIEYTAANTLENETIVKIDGLKNTYFTLIAGAEATYSVNKRISVGINPVIRYGITSVNKGTPVKTYPINMGIGASIKLKL